MNLVEAMECAKAKVAELVNALNEMCVETYYEDYDGTLEIVVKSKDTDKELHSVKVLHPETNEMINDDTQYTVVHTAKLNSIAELNNVVIFTADGVTWFKHYHQ